MADQDIEGGLVANPGAIPPSQFYRDPARANMDKGIRRLLRTILDDAIKIYRFGIRGNKQLFAETELWLWEERPHGCWFSFVNICEALGMEPRSVRKAITQWRGNGSGRPITPKLARRAPVIATSRIIRGRIGI
jgi:hypothetical protein